MEELAQRKPQYDIEIGLQRKLADLQKQVEQAIAGPMKDSANAASAKSAESIYLTGRNFKTF